MVLFAESEDLECFAPGSGDCTGSSGPDARLFGAIFPAPNRVKFREAVSTPHRGLIWERVDPLASNGRIRRRGTARIGQGTSPWT